jgi:hypothetical protein
MKELIEKNQLSIQSFHDLILKKYDYKISPDTIESCLINLNFEFTTQSKPGSSDKKHHALKDIYGLSVINIENEVFVLEQDFLDMLKNKMFLDFLLDTIEYAICVYNSKFDIHKYHSGFLLYEKYSRKDVFRILNWKQNPNAQNVGGYIVSKEKRQCPIFVNYHDHPDNNSTQYEDRFMSSHKFSWMSKAGRSMNSPCVSAIRSNTYRIPLFIKKNVDEGLDFYYMGDIKEIKDQFKQTTMLNGKGKTVSVVNVIYDMEIPVEAEIYDYLHLIESP